MTLRTTLLLLFVPFLLSAQDRLTDLQHGEVARSDLLSVCSADTSLYGVFRRVNPDERTGLLSRLDPATGQPTALLSPAQSTFDGNFVPLHLPSVFELGGMTLALIADRANGGLVYRVSGDSVIPLLEVPNLRTSTFAELNGRVYFLAEISAPYADGATLTTPPVALVETDGTVAGTTILAELPNARLGDQRSTVTAGETELLLHVVGENLELYRWRYSLTAGRLSRVGLDVPNFARPGRQVAHTEIYHDGFFYAVGTLRSNTLFPVLLRLREGSGEEETIALPSTYPGGATLGGASAMNIYLLGEEIVVCNDFRRLPGGTFLYVISPTDPVDIRELDVPQPGSVPRQAYLFPVVSGDTLFFGRRRAQGVSLMRYTPGMPAAREIREYDFFGDARMYAAPNWLYVLGVSPEISGNLYLDRGAFVRRFVPILGNGDRLPEAYPGFALRGDSLVGPFHREQFNSGATVFIPPGNTARRWPFISERGFPGRVELIGYDRATDQALLSVPMGESSVQYSPVDLTTGSIGSPLVPSPGNTRPNSFVYRGTTGGQAIFTAVSNNGIQDAYRFRNGELERLAIRVRNGLPVFVASIDDVTILEDGYLGLSVPEVAGTADIRVFLRDEDQVIGERWERSARLPAEYATWQDVRFAHRASPQTARVRFEIMEDEEIRQIFNERDPTLSVLHVTPGGTYFYRADTVPEILFRGTDRTEVRWPAENLTLPVPEAGAGHYQHLGDSLFFVAGSPAEGAELYVISPDADSLRMVSNLRPGPRSGIPGQRLLRWRDELWFVGNDGRLGNELWRTDGTPDGTVLTGDLFPGAGGSAPYDLTLTDGRLLFGANGPRGYELYGVDSTANRPELLVELGRSRMSGFGYAPYLRGDTLYFLGHESTGSFAQFYRFTEPLFTSIRAPFATPTLPPRAYPNPTDDRVKLEAPPGETIQAGALYDTNGQLLRRSNGGRTAWVISLESLPAGTYWASVRYSSGRRGGVAVVKR